MTHHDTPQLYRLVYYSRNRVAGGAESEIDDILAASRRNNAADAITGALIFNGGIFAQVLEGEQSAVETTFERIQRDSRHGDVQVLAFEPVAARAFPSWSMGFIGRSRANESLFGGMAAETGFDASRLEGDRVFSIMRDIALEEERAAA